MSSSSDKIECPTLFRIYKGVGDSRRYYRSPAVQFSMDPSKAYLVKQALLADLWDEDSSDWVLSILKDFEKEPAIKPKDPIPDVQQKDLPE